MAHFSKALLKREIASARPTRSRERVRNVKISGYVPMLSVVLCKDLINVVVDDGDDSHSVHLTYASLRVPLKSLRKTRGELAGSSRRRAKQFCFGKTRRGVDRSKQSRAIQSGAYKRPSIDRLFDIPRDMRRLRR